MSGSLSEEDVAALRHELRTCLNQARGYCELIIDELGGEVTEAVAGRLDLIMRRSDELLTLVSGCLGEGAGVSVADLARLADSGRLACGDIRDAVAELKVSLGNGRHAAEDVLKIGLAIGRWRTALDQRVKSSGDGC